MICPKCQYQRQAHDWWQPLTMTDNLVYAPHLARLCFGVGAALIILSNIWGAALFYIEVNGRLGNESGNQEQPINEDQPCL